MVQSLWSAYKVGAGVVIVIAVVAHIAVLAAAVVVVVVRFVPLAQSRL